MLAVGQDPRFPISRKRTGATWRKRLKSGEVRGGLEDSIPGTRGGHRKAQSTCLGPGAEGAANQFGAPKPTCYLVLARTVFQIPLGWF